jgi:hypothetical protein
MAARELAQGKLGRGDQAGQLSGAEGGRDLDPPGQCEAAKLAAQLVGRGDHQAVELVGGLGACLHRRAARHP